MPETTVETTGLDLTEVMEPRILEESTRRAERVAFLALASELARDRRVLIVDNGASALSGIAAHLDSIELTALDSATAEDYSLIVADLSATDAPSIEAVREFSRIATADEGIALLRLPNRPEFVALRDEFESGFAKTLTMRQLNWTASALLDDAMFENEDPARAVAACVRKVSAAQPGEERHIVLVGSHGDFPALRPQIAMTHALDLEDSLELAADRARLESALADADLHRALQATEIAELKEELARSDAELATSQEQVDGAVRMAKLVGLAAAAFSIFGRIRRSRRS